MKQKTDFYFAHAEDFNNSLPGLSTYSHKGNNGRVQLVSGSKGKMGAAVMAGLATMRSGAGLLFVQSPKCGTSILQQSVIEGMVIEDSDEAEITGILAHKNIDSLGIGPGIGMSENTTGALVDFLTNGQWKSPLVLDADAINILSENKELLTRIPDNSILTPHPGEFKRLVGDWDNDFEKLQLLRNLCTAHKLNVVVKGAYSTICNPDGVVTFNSTGNPGMATAGSGDVLFGVICGLLGQGLVPEAALRTGVYLHGLAGDLAADTFGMRSMIARDIISKLPEAFRKTGL